MLFYFVRHGETEANRTEKLAGSGLDHCLNPSGHAQARALAAKIQSVWTGPKPTRLIASDMTRARETAEYLSRQLNLPLELEPAFREWNLGEWEGQPYSAFSHLILGDGEPREGEKRRDFYDRIARAWRGVHHDERPYLIVSHGAVWLALQDLLNIPRFKISNCELVKIEKGASAWSAQIVG